MSQCPHIVGMSSCEECLREEIERLTAENARLRQALIDNWCDELEELEKVLKEPIAKKGGE